MSECVCVCVRERERERERLHHQFILVQSTSELHPVPKTTTGFSTSNQSHITHTQSHKEVIWITQEHLPSFPFTQPQSEHHLTLQVYKLYKYRNCLLYTSPSPRD